MIRGLYTSSAGMQVESMRQEAIANNLANLNTSGFKRDMAVVEARTSLKLVRANNQTSNDPHGSTRRVPIGELGTGVEVNRIVKRFDQGQLHESGNPFDLALQDAPGAGGAQGQPSFFTLQDGHGNTFYTRDGAFTRDAQGFIVDKGGKYLMGSAGRLQVPNGHFQVALDGTVSVDGRSQGRLALASFANPDDQLEHTGDTLFKAHGSAQPLASNAGVSQGMVEGANVNSVREMVDMIACMRQYEANQKAALSQDETLQKAVNDVGHS